MKRCIALLCVLLAITQSCHAVDNPYLRAPSRAIGKGILYNPYVVHAMQFFKLLPPVHFTWNFAGGSLLFTFACGKAGLAITSLTVPADYPEQFHEVRQQDAAMFVYTAGTIAMSLPIPEACPQQSSNYCVAQPRKFLELPTVQQAEVEQVASYIRGHSVVLYTGAGISIACGVPSMAHLEEALFVEHHNGTLNMKKIVESAPLVIERFKHFCNAACSLQPSKAHYAVADITGIKKCALFTENIDIGHQKTGIHPIMPESTIKEHGPYFKEIDAIVCIGLSHDDRGLLAFYKKQNPTGIIIAIDIKQPDYLGQEDKWLQGDLQELVPMIAKKIGA